MTLEQQIDALAAEADRAYWFADCHDVAEDPEQYSANHTETKQLVAAYTKLLRCWQAERKLREAEAVWQDVGRKAGVRLEHVQAVHEEAEAILKGES